MDETQSFAVQSRKIREKSLQTASDEVKQKMNRAMQELMASNAGEHAKTTGDNVPLFSLANAHGQQVNIADRLETGPVVLSFYRGGWCPFCNLEFNALQQILPEIQNQGAQLIGISPETPDTTQETVSKHGLKFEVLSDPGNVVSRQFGLIMTVSEEMRPLYLQWGLDIPAANGDDTWELPLPATYVIDTRGKIRASYVNKDYTLRMEPTAILEALQSI